MRLRGEKKIQRYPDTRKEGGGRERIGCKAGSLGLSLDFVIFLWNFLKE
jgi:hypothetical protein